MARILRGDIVWAELDPTQGHEQAGRRPVVVLSQDVFNERSGTVIACALTGQEPRAGFPLTMELAGKKWPKRSWGQDQSDQDTFRETAGKETRTSFS